MSNNISVDDTLLILGKVKENLGTMFMRDTDIRTLIMPTLDDSACTAAMNWYGGTYNVNGETKTLVGHCFDGIFVKETIPDNRSFIAMDTIISSMTGSQIMQVMLMIYVCSHKDSIKLDNETASAFHQKGYAGNRIDMTLMGINNCIRKYQNDKDLPFGIGKLDIDTYQPMQIYQPYEKFYGKQINYVLTDFYKM